MKIRTNNYLYERVIAYINKYYNKLYIITPCNGIGPDVVIMNRTEKYNGLFIEFKEPTKEDDLLVNEYRMLKKARNLGIKVIVSEDYDYIIYKITRYANDCFYEIRIRCGSCSKSFQTTDSLHTHMIKYHDNDIEEFISYEDDDQ